MWRCYVQKEAGKTSISETWVFRILLIVIRYIGISWVSFRMLYMQAFATQMFLFFFRQCLRIRHMRLQHVTIRDTVCTVSRPWVCIGNKKFKIAQKCNFLENIISRIKVLFRIDYEIFRTSYNENKWITRSRVRGKCWERCRCINSYDFNNIPKLKLYVKLYKNRITYVFHSKETFFYNYTLWLMQWYKVFEYVYNTE